MIATYGCVSTLHGVCGTKSTNKTFFKTSLLLSGHMGVQQSQTVQLNAHIYLRG